MEEQMVIIILRLSKLREKYAKMFDVVPPGIQPIRTSPTVCSTVKSNILANTNAKNGIIRYCEENPTPTACGWRSASRKSLKVSEDPMPNMMMTIMIDSNDSSRGLNIVFFLLIVFLQ
jgi:hypothetical protein